MAEQIEQAARTAGRTFNISLAELAGANAGQRNDLLALNQAVYRVPEGTLYTSDGAQLVPAQGLPVTASTNPSPGGLEFPRQVSRRSIYEPLTREVSWRHRAPRC